MYKRLTKVRLNGIKSGYWSPSTKEELVARLAEYENTGLSLAKVVALQTLHDIAMERVTELKRVINTLQRKIQHALEKRRHETIQKGCDE